MSGTPGPSNTGKAIASLAKMPAADTTRAGTQKMKFIPTLPIRRKKEEVKQEPAAPIPAPTAASSDRGSGGRGQGRGRTRGDSSRGGRAAASTAAAASSRPPPPEMTASGPFAMGPSQAGSSAWRSGPRVAAVSAAPRGPLDPAALGANLTKTAGPALKKEERGVEPRVHVEDDVEVYSDPDEGVEIVDMRNVHTMDWMAPESLKSESARERSKKRLARAKKEEQAEEQTLKAKRGPIAREGPPVDDVGDINLANALDLSESEEEEVMEDIIDDFAQDSEDQSLQQERLYFFQFPSPFPAFVSKSSEHSDDHGDKSHVPEQQAKRVSFSADTKPPASVPEDVDNDQPPPPHVDGVIGQLEIYKSGAVKMRLANGILLDITAATQSSFLQQAVHVDRATKNLRVLGEVGRRFVVTPDIDSLLEAMTQADEAAVEKIETDGLIPMDTT